MKVNVPVDYFKTPIDKYTFRSKDIRLWVEELCKEKLTLNLYAGCTKLNINETRNDSNKEMPADYHYDAADFCRYFSRFGGIFDAIILDPPYSERKSMELYDGHKRSRFNIVLDLLPTMLAENGIVITFGYNSNVMGKTRNFKLERLGMFCHGGAIHDTIASVERKNKQC